MFSPLFVWALLIFTTSCFFIPVRTFFHFVQRLPLGPALIVWFEGFWKRYWFVFVKGWHVMEYAILTTLGAKALRRVNPRATVSSVWMSFGFAVAFAASDEWHQTFVPGRGGRVSDVLIDTCGALVATLYLTLGSRLVMRFRAGRSHPRRRAGRGSRGR
jgi:hypothetical protein